MKFKPKRVFTLIFFIFKIFDRHKFFMLIISIKMQPGRYFATFFGRNRVLISTLGFIYIINFCNGPIFLWRRPFPTNRHPKHCMQWSNDLKWAWKFVWLDVQRKHVFITIHEPRKLDDGWLNLRWEPKRVIVFIFWLNNDKSTQSWTCLIPTM